MRPALPVTCLGCGGEVSWRHVTVHTQFACPNCGQALHLRNNYFRVLILFAIIVAGLLSYAVGVRGDALLPVVFIAMWPMEFVLLFVSCACFHRMSKQPATFAASSMARAD